MDSCRRPARVLGAGRVVGVQIGTFLGDITTLTVDAIVNAANERLTRGGGVCGAIHTAAGPQLALACAEIGGCDTGSAVATPGFDLAARWVIHAVGPVWDGGDRDEPELLASAYRRSIEIADELGAESIAFPAISTGIYGMPLEVGCDVAVRTLVALDPRSTQRCVLVAFDAPTLDALQSALARGGHSSD
ncbi:MAG: macro domain-containing protein [Actinomycetia bacterium]|nr:macro domain-containing protein [Actinomycetes bacterium]